jgi:hypothetical protein
LYCFESSNGGRIEFWRYPTGGNPFKIYWTVDEDNGPGRQHGTSNPRIPASFA